MCHGESSSDDPRYVVVHDNILVTGHTEEGHLKVLSEVLCRFGEIGMWL